MSQTVVTPGGSRPALAAGLICYSLWGVIPLLFLALSRLGVSPWEIVVQRVIWATPCAALLVVASGQTSQALVALRKPKVLGLLALSAALISGNWLVFVWATNNGHNLECSLGYFINPLLVMAAGAILFGERIGPAGYAAIGLTAIGVLIQTLALGHPPWVSLILALSFGGYGLIRRQVEAEAQTGLLLECLFIIAPGLAMLGWLCTHGGVQFGRTAGASLLLLFCGPATVIPLALFSWSARRLPFSTLGFLQFVSPSLTFVIGLAMGEPMPAARIVSFLFIWAGVGVFAYGLWRANQRAAAYIAS
jgi:chloramphenicol-sensitive protein RarD